MAEEYVQAWLEAGSRGDQMDEEGAINEIVGSLELGTLKFHEFIFVLSSRLEREQDLVVAGRILQLLSRVFDAIRIEIQPSRNDIHTFIPYLCTRVEDVSPGLYYVAESLNIMSTWKSFPPGDAQAVAVSIFKLGASNVFASQTSNTRLALYELVNVLFRTHPAALKRDLSVKALVNGLVAMAELEKNPSCLRVLFSLYTHISQEWSLGVDDFKTTFGSFIRYFPISMKEVVQDPSIPSTGELRELLLRCFVSSDGYAEMTFDAMMDRLDVDSANTKVQVFKTIEEGLKSYSIMAVSLSAAKLWDTLKFEVWNGEIEEFIQSSLDVLKLLAASLDKSPWDWLENDNPLHSFVVNALGECKKRIQDKESTYLGPCGRIFNAIASASFYSFYLAIKFMLPVLDLLWQTHTSGPEKTTVLEALNGILRARLVQVDVVPLPEEEFAALSAELQEYLQLSESHMTNVFSEHRDRIIEMYHQDVLRAMSNTDLSENVSYAVPAIQGMEMIFNAPFCLEYSEKSMMVGELLEIALNRGQNKAIREQDLIALGKISAKEPKLFREIILPEIMGKLPEKLSSDPQQQSSELPEAITYLQDFVRISSTSQSSIDSMQEHLVKKLGEIMQHNGQGQYLHALLAAMLSDLTSDNFDLDKRAGITEVQPKISLEDGSHGDIVLKLFEKVVRAKAQVGNPLLGYTGLSDDCDNIDNKFIELVGTFAMKCLRNENTYDQNWLTSWNTSHPNEPSAIWSLFTQSAQPATLDLSQASLELAPPDKCLANALSMYLVAGTRREGKETLRINIGRTAQYMIRNAVVPNENCSKFARVSILWFLQLLVNKFDAAKESAAHDEKTLVESMRKYVELTSEKGQSKVQGINTFQTLAYFAAASLAALDPSTTILVQMMLDNIANPKYGRKVAQSFRILLMPSDIITKENFCHLRPLRKGRLYELAVKPLIAMWRENTDPVIKQNYLVALAGIIAFLEPQMLSDYAREILPVLLEGTNIQGDDLAKGACINGLLQVIPTFPEIIEEHLGSVINRMTDRTHNTLDSPSDSNAQSRAMALDVLHALTQHVKPGLLIRKKPALMSELDVALEDCSREVRHKAERCKMAWFNLVESE